MDANQARNYPAKQSTRKRFIARFAVEAEARDAMVARNRAYRDAGNRRDLACLIEGPDDGWTVCDLETAIETGLPYTWCASTVR